MNYEYELEEGKRIVKGAAELRNDPDLNYEYELGEGAKMIELYNGILGMPRNIMDTLGAINEWALPDVPKYGPPKMK